MALLVFFDNVFKYILPLKTDEINQLYSVAVTQLSESESTFINKKSSL